MPEILTQPPRVTFATHQVQPPTPLYVGRDDRLFLRAFNSLAGLSVTTTGRLLDTDGLIKTILHSFTPTTDRVNSQAEQQLFEGYLLNLRMNVAGASAQRGQCFVQANLFRGNLPNPLQVACLISDYATILVPAAWPTGQLHHSIEGPGALRVITGTDPAAGTELSETVPTKARWRLIAFTFQYVSSAVAGARRVELTFDDGATVYARIQPAATFDANTTARMGYLGGGSAYTPAGSAMTMPLPHPAYLFAGHRIRTSSVGADVGDNIGAPTYLVEEWIED